MLRFEHRNSIQVFKSLFRANLCADSAESAFASAPSAVRLNHLLGQFAEPTYLEVGVSRGQTFEAVKADWRVGVDPQPLFNFLRLPRNSEFWVSTSDYFFRKSKETFFDVIFLDGLHEAEQTYRDLLAALEVLNNRGFILIDDVWPTEYESSIPNQDESTKMKELVGISHNRWYGDVFRVIWAVQEFHPELSIQVVGNADSEHAQAIVRRTDELPQITNTDEIVSAMKNVSYRDVFGEVLQEPWASAIAQRWLLANDSPR